ncbi:uncharacterized protein LOC128641777 [Bombina bombina]|uniref:uncharacterized protein LOC128641777 n=1 Tax=Bombina bombina TaxID=8345 RepID=UPI00235AADEC|nr:uncharacterized protein LOC128641777 [Bombina bombina]
MGCNIPPSDIIPAVAARLQYYVEIQRKEAGFDLSGIQGNKKEKYRLYQYSQAQGVHHTQRFKKNFLDNQMEAALRSYAGKSRRGQDKTLEINPEQKKHTQNRIRKKMSSLAISDKMNNSNVCLRRQTVKQRLLNDRGSISSDRTQISAPQVSYKEFRRLISTAANLIVATTSDENKQNSSDLHKKDLCSPSWNYYEKLILPYIPFPQHRVYNSLKEQKAQSQSPESVKITSSLHESFTISEPVSLDETDHREDMDLTCKMNETFIQESEISVANKEEENYEIRVYTGSSTEANVKQILNITLVGSNGQSRKLSLETSSTNPVPFCSGQTDIFKMKTKDVGVLEQVIVGMKRKSAGFKCYCEDIIVKKGSPTAEVYVFPFNRWLSSNQTVLQVLPHIPEDTNVVNKPHIQSQDKQQMKIKSIEKSSLVDSNVDDHGKVPSPSQLLEEAQLLMYPDPEETITCKEVELDKELASVNSKINVIKESGLSIDKLVPENSAAATNSLTNSEKPFTNTEIPVETKIDISLEKHAQEPSQLDGSQFEEVTNGDASYKPSLEENENKNRIINKSSHTAKSELIQKKIQRDVSKHKKASSPPPYVFFSNGVKKSTDVGEEQSEGNSTGDSIKPNKIQSDIATPVGIDQRASSAINNEGNRNASQLFLLQQILLEPMDSSSARSLGAESQDSCRGLENMETKDSCVTDNDLKTSHVHVNEQCCHPIDQIVQTTVTCEDDGSSFISDTTLAEDFLFSDTSLILSLSENEDLRDFAPGYSSDSENHQPRHMTEDQEMRRRDGRINNNFKKAKFREDISVLFQEALDAISIKDKDVLKNMCQAHFFLLSATDKEGKTLLHHAATHGNASMCQALLDSNVGMINIDRQDFFGRTALHYAVLNGNSKIVKLLLNNGAKFEISDKNSETVLDLALSHVEEM